MWRLNPTKKFKLKKGAWFIPGFGVFTFQLFWLELVLSSKRETQKIELLLLSAAPQLQTAHIAFDLFSSNHPFQRRLFFRETFDCYFWVSDLSSVASTRKLVADWVEVFRCPGWRIFKACDTSWRVWVLGEPFLGFEVLPKHHEGKPPFQRWNF